MCGVVQQIQNSTQEKKSQAAKLGFFCYQLDNSRMQHKSDSNLSPPPPSRAHGSWVKVLLFFVSFAGWDSTVQYAP